MYMYQKLDWVPPLKHREETVCSVVYNSAMLFFTNCCGNQVSASKNSVAELSILSHIHLNPISTIYMYADTCHIHDITCTHVHAWHYYMYPCTCVTLLHVPMYMHDITCTHVHAWHCNGRLWAPRRLTLWHMHGLLFLAGVPSPERFISCPSWKGSWLACAYYLKSCLGHAHITSCVCVCE